MAAQSAEVHGKSQCLGLRATKLPYVMHWDRSNQIRPFGHLMPNVFELRVENGTFAVFPLLLYLNYLGNEFSDIYCRDPHCPEKVARHGGMLC